MDRKRHPALDKIEGRTPAPTEGGDSEEAEVYRMLEVERMKRHARCWQSLCAVVRSMLLLAGLIAMFWVLVSLFDLIRGSP